MLRWHITVLTYAIFGLIGLGYPVFACATTTVLPDEYRQKIDLAVMRNAIDRPALLATITWIRQLAQSTQNPAVIAELARLECANAEIESETEQRIALYIRCIETADIALANNRDEVVALYWKAVALGKLSEEKGILNALRSMRPIEKLFLRVIELNENYDNAGGHKALGRMYFKLPGFPISFGNKEKALYHLKRAYELFPYDIIALAFYAEALFETGNKSEARQIAEFILTAPIEPENVFRYNTFLDIAHEILRKTT